MKKKHNPKLYVEKPSYAEPFTPMPLLFGKMLKAMNAALQAKLFEHPLNCLQIKCVVFFIWCIEILSHKVQTYC